MSEFHNLLSRLNEKDILLSTPKMDNSNYTEALDFLTGRELSKLKRDALAEYQDLQRQLAEAREALLDFEKHVIKHNYHVSNPILNKHETLLKQLKEQGK